MGEPTRMRLPRLAPRAATATAVVVAAVLVGLVPVGPAATADPRIVLPVVDLDCRGDQPGSVVEPVELAPASTEPVLLVHGTFTNGDENYRWALAEQLGAQGFAVCWFSYGNRGLDDMQSSAEATAAAILQLHDATGQPVDVLGHSQGAVLPRWAVRWFTAVRSVVDDLVLLAGPQHGTELNDGGCNEYCTGAFWQMDPGSQFIAALNSGQETFEEIDYTSIYTDFDLLVRPPEASALSDPDPTTANVVNVRLQDLCPGRPVDHATLFIDHVMERLAVDALTGDGPADPATIDLADCAQPFFTGADPVLGLQVGVESFVERKGFEYRPVPEEPPLRSYAQAG